VGRYDDNHKRQALKTVDAIEKLNSTKLTPQLRKLADDYAVQVLGRIEYAPWLYVYSLVSGAFKEGWIPDNFFGRLVAPKVNNGLGSLTEYKSFTNVVFRTDALPDVAYFLNDVIYSKDYRPISTAELRSMLAGRCTHVFAKKDGTSRGKGIAKLDVRSIDEQALRQVGNCVIQLPIEQHGFFDGIVTGSVATIRMTTVKDSLGRIDLRAAYLRLGRNNTEWVQSDNSVRVAILGANGELDSVGYTEDWRRWSSHPDTQFRFADRQVPNFAAAARACLAWHASVPHFTIVGWDVAVDRNGDVKLIEWNGGHCDIKFSEAAAGPCFRGLQWEQFREQ
jgi:hypothetical protein